MFKPTQPAKNCSSCLPRGPQQKVLHGPIKSAKRPTFGLRPIVCRRLLCCITLNIVFLCNSMRSSNQQEMYYLALHSIILSNTTFKSAIFLPWLAKIVNFLFICRCQNNICVEIFDFPTNVIKSQCFSTKQIDNDETNPTNTC